jgi:hypothetical protein
MFVPREIVQAMSMHRAGQTLLKMLSPTPRRDENHREHENGNSDTDAYDCLAHFLDLLGKVVPRTTCPDERPHPRSHQDFHMPPSSTIIATPTAGRSLE